MYHRSQVLILSPIFQSLCHVPPQLGFDIESNVPGTHHVPPQSGFDTESNVPVILSCTTTVRFWYLVQCSSHFVMCHRSQVLILSPMFQSLCHVPPQSGFDIESNFPGTLSCTTAVRFWYLVQCSSHSVMYHRRQVLIFSPMFQSLIMYHRSQVLVLTPMSHSFTTKVYLLLGSKK